jgi:phage-related protein
VKPLIFCGNALSTIRGFPVDARQDAGFQLDSLQRGNLPDDWRPFRTIGRSVKEIRINTSGQFRVIVFDGNPEAI